VSAATRRLGLMGLASALAAACTPARFFNALAPADPARRSANGIAFGPGPRQKLDVYSPPRTRGPSPVALFIYGGGWDSGARGEYGWAGKALAAEGFLTLVPDYRLTPEVAFPTFLEDVALAVRWAVDHAGDFGGDPSQVVLVGHSAGAYNVAMVSLDPRYLAAVKVDPACIRAFAGLAGPYVFKSLAGPVLQRTFGSAAETDDYQTLRYVSAKAPPAFLATGDADKTVSPSNTTRLSEALRAQGVPVETHVYPGLSHTDVLLGLSRILRRRFAVHDDMMRFLKTRVGLPVS